MDFVLKAGSQGQHMGRVVIWGTELKQHWGRTQEGEQRAVERQPGQAVPEEARRAAQKTAVRKAGSDSLHNTKEMGPPAECGKHRVRASSLDEGCS